jgi:hypothetical protein
MLTYNWITALLGLGAASAIVVLLRRNALYTRYSMWWLAIAGLVLIFGLFPRLSDRLAAIFHVGYPPALMFAAAIVLLVIKILFMDLDRSNQELRIRRLTQRIALLQERLERDGDGEE